MLDKQVWWYSRCGVRCGTRDLIFLGFTLAELLQLQFTSDGTSNFFGPSSAAVGRGAWGRRAWGADAGDDLPNFQGINLPWRSVGRLEK